MHAHCALRIAHLAHSDHGAHRLKTFGQYCGHEPGKIRFLYAMSTLLQRHIMQKQKIWLCKQLCKDREYRCITFTPRACSTWCLGTI